MSQTDNILDDRRERRRLPMVGLVLSAIYVAGVTIYLVLQGQNPADLRLNELGDFVGGVSSPLAFLWLVLGFFQQSREIRLSNKALHLQAREMRRSVDEHRRIAGGTDEGGASMTDTTETNRAALTVSRAFLRPPDRARAAGARSARATTCESRRRDSRAGR